MRRRGPLPYGEWIGSDRADGTAEEAKAWPTPPVASRLAGLVTSGAGVLVVLVLHVVPPTSRISPLRRTISEYGLTSLAWAFGVGVLALAAGSALIFGAALFGRRPPVHPMSPGSPVRPVSVAAVAFAALWVAALSVLVVFPKHNWALGPSGGGNVHRLASLVAFLALPIGVLLAHRGTWQRRTAIWGRVLAVGGLAWFAPIVIAIATQVARRACVVAGDPARADRTGIGAHRGTGPADGRDRGAGTAAGPDPGHIRATGAGQPGRLSSRAIALIVSGPTRQHPPTRRGAPGHPVEHLRGVQTARPSPAPGAGVPPFSAVRIGDHRLARGAGGSVDQPRHLGSVDAVHPDGHDLRDRAGHRERRVHVFPRPGSPVRGGDRQPRGHSRSRDQLAQGLDLGQARDRLHRQDVGPRLGQYPESRRMPFPQLGHGQPVVAAVLRAVGQGRPVRPDRGRDEAGHIVGGRVPGVAGQPDAASQRPFRVSAGQPDGLEPVCADLVGAGDRHPGSRLEEGGVRRDQRGRILHQQPRGPERGRQVVAAGLQQGRQPTVEQDRADGHRLRHARPGHLSSPPAARPRDRPESVGRRYVAANARQPGGR